MTGRRGTITAHWFLPTYGDSRGLIAGGHGTGMAGDRVGTLPYLRQLAQAAEYSGFESMLIPTGLWCEDAWVTAALLTEATSTLKFLVALRPGLMSPTLAAQMASTLQWQSQGRLLLNVVTGGEAHEQAAYGDDLDKAARYARCDEFLDIVTRLWREDGPLTVTGEHEHVSGASLQRRPAPVPPLYFGGSSAEAGPVAARHADVYLTWGEPVPAVAEKLQWIRGLARRQDRTPEFGIRLHVISRDTSEEAWAEADRLLRGIDPAEVDRVQQNLARSQSEGQRRMSELHAGRTRDVRSLEVAPNLWAGVGLVRGGAGTALVGSHDEVVDRIAEYADLGITHLILSGYPHLEESLRVGEEVLPRLGERGLWNAPDAGRYTETGQSEPAVPFAVGAR
ncbi:alkanesulfonate monooxygenase [Marmoricola endophyticus]|uniref:Alkanesulfonate monooxygenase n=1 Tax=Marmoricola endophyticus TaxID=2040280 RepID=A0A917F295_9ACTN|nr:LLM class flavin-dependent oxidoreductase [Marmoricola endophyticus]GGF45853.1 alkanesulfonate monooxygenase [Marmoricola endophyticus]